MKNNKKSVTINPDTIDNSSLPLCKNDEFEGVTHMEDNEAFTLEEKYSFFADRLRDEIKISNKAIADAQAIAEQYRILQAEYDEIKLAKTDPIQYIVTTFCPRNELFFKYPTGNKLFKHVNNEKGRWISLEQYAQIKETVHNNPTFFYKGKVVSSKIKN